MAANKRYCTKKLAGIRHFPLSTSEYAIQIIYFGNQCHFPRLERVFIMDSICLFESAAPNYFRISPRFSFSFSNAAMPIRINSNVAWVRLGKRFSKRKSSIFCNSSASRVMV